MSKLAIRLFIFYSIIFTSQKLLDIFLGGLSSPIKIVLTLCLWVIVFALYRDKLSKQEKKLADRCLLFLGLLLAIAAVISIEIHKIPFIVVAYIAISYFSFYPLIYLIIYIKRNPKNFKKILLFCITLYSIISIGIIYDAFGGLTKTPIIGERLIALEKEQKTQKIYNYRGEQRRGSFLMESSTIVFPVLSTSFLAIAILKKSSTNKRNNLLTTSFTSSVLIWLACFFSLSRTPLFLISAMIFCFFAKIAGIGTSKKLLRQISFVGFIVALLIASTQVQSYLYNQIDSSAVDAFNSGISSEDIANKKRFQAWGKGLELFTESEVWLGNGLGTSRVGLESYLGSKAEYHYESSLLSGLSEAGIIGIFIEILPLLVIIYIAIRKKADNIFIIWALLFVINLFVAPITAYSTMFARYLGMGLCIASTLPERPKYKQLQPMEVIYYQ